MRYLANCRNCKKKILGEVYRGQLCYKCWLMICQEQAPGYDMTGSEWENFMEDLED